MPSAATKADMFSITPATRMCDLRAIVTARAATFWAPVAGVVTTISSARGSMRARPMATSPVPGGMSIIM